MNSPLIEFKNIYLKTKDGKELFRDLNFTLTKGEKVLIKGESGSGKSTFLKILPGGVLPDNGEVFFKGEKVSAANIQFVRDHLFYVSQHLVNGAFTPFDIIKLPFQFKNRKNYPVKDDDIFTLAEKFNLDKNVFTRDLRLLSGGEKQRLAVIRAVLAKPEIFLLDEVTNSLDPDAAKKVILFFSKVPETVIAVSHDKSWNNYSQNEMVLKEGRLNECCC